MFETGSSVFTDCHVFVKESVKKKITLILDARQSVAPDLLVQQQLLIKHTFKNELS